MILDTIVAHKRIELADDKQRMPLDTLKRKIRDLPPTRDFRAALSVPNCVHLIAEVKKKSPSKGIIREDFEPVRIARTYAENGASAISVLTDREFFAGELAYLSAIREAVTLPLLRKDFTIDPYHIYQARLAGADAVLLIASILTLGQLREFTEIARSLGLASLIEVHNRRRIGIGVNSGRGNCWNQ